MQSCGKPDLAAVCNMLNRTVAASLLRFDLAKNLPNISMASLGKLSRHGFTIGAQPPPMELIVSG
eukprot:m.404984 g.404984  ORF g.404984 m.404984 type:complete len:65 (-) comp21203_c0_seq4:741-935(-)